MKVKLILLQSALLVLSAAWAGDGGTPILSGIPDRWAQVTIPYQHLKDLWDLERKTNEAEKAKKPVPVEGFLTSAEYELSLDSDPSVLAVKYDGESLSDCWHSIPLIGGDVRLRSIQESEGRSRIVWKDQQYQFLTDQPGPFTLHLQFVISQSLLSHQGPELRLGNAAINRLEISGAPPNQIVRLPDLTPQIGADGAVLYDLHSEGSNLVLSLQPYAPPNPPAPIQASDWKLQTETLVRFDDGRLQHLGKAYCHANSGSGLSMALQFPSQAANIEIVGDDLIEQQTSGIVTNGSNRTFDLRWATRNRLNRSFVFTYDVPISPLETNWPLLSPSILGQNTVSFFAIQKVQGIEVTAPGLTSSTESRRLPNWLQERIGAHDYATLEDDGSSPVDVTVNWLPRIETKQAVISKAQFQSQLVPDGSLLVHGAYTIDHQIPVAWQLAMPNYDEFLTCQVNGLTIQPTSRGEADIEIDLPVQEKGKSDVRFSYTAEVAEFDPISGKFEIDLPRTQLFIHELLWELSLPDRYESTALEGNLQISIAQAEQASAPSNLRLHKKLIRNESPHLEVYYQHQDRGE